MSYGNIKAQTVPDKKEILKVTLHVNDYFMKKYADYRTPSFVKKVVRPSNIWTRSVYYEGLMALYSIYPPPVVYLWSIDQHIHIGFRFPYFFRIGANVV